VNSENVAVIVEEVEMPAAANSPALDSKGTPRIDALVARHIVTNRSRLRAELMGVGSNCTLAAASAAGMFGGAVLELPSGGASTLLIVASWTGLFAGAIACGNGLVRVGTAYANLDGNSLDRWDSNSSYSMIMLAVDAIGVATNVATLPFNVRNLWAVISRLRAFRAQNLSFDALHAMNRLQRMRALSRVFQDATRTQEGLESVMKAAREAQIGAQTFQRSSGLSVNHADTLVRVTGDETTRRLETALLNVLGNIATPAMSATPAGLTGSASGSINYIVHLLDAGRPNF
jgi:hypothetical protein